MYRYVICVYSFKLFFFLKPPSWQIPGYVTVQSGTHKYLKVSSTLRVLLWLEPSRWRVCSTHSTGLWCPRYRTCACSNNRSVRFAAFPARGIFPTCTKSPLPVHTHGYTNLFARFSRLKWKKKINKSRFERVTQYFAIGYGVENGLDFHRVVHAHADRMRRGQRVESQPLLRLVQHELSHHRPAGHHVLHAAVLQEAGEPFVQPQVVPPSHRHQIPEPLVGQLVGHDHGHPLVRGGRCFIFVVEYRSLPVRDQAPILHGAGAEIRYGDQVCMPTHATTHEVRKLEFNQNFVPERSETHLGGRQEGLWPGRKYFRSDKFWKPFWYLYGTFRLIKKVITKSLLWL